jgi:uncharacterized lipoprotein YddW (UPF0748 family)
MSTNAQVIASSLNLRSQPDISSATLASLPSGSIVEILKTLAGGSYPFSGGTRDDWHQVNASGQRGFVAASFTSLIHTPPVTRSSSATAEIRGVWIVDHSNSSVLKSPADIIKALDFLQLNGFNTVFPAVWNRGFTAFPSQVMVNNGFPKQDPFYASLGFDPLQEIVQQGKVRSMAIIPWFEYGFAASPDTDGGHILRSKPKWSALDNTGSLLRHGNLTWMNSLHPEVQQFMLDLIIEVIQTYDVDGIQGDDRLPAMPFNGGYDDTTKDAFKAKFGINPPQNGIDSTWVRFRADLLTQYLGKIFSQVKSTKASCIVSMAPAPFPFCLNNLMQDSDTWVRKNIVDFLHPQLYRTSFAGYKAEIDRIVKNFTILQQTKFAPGIALKANSINLKSSEIVDFVKLDRSNGLGGQIFFFFEGLMKNNDEIATALRIESGYDQIATLPPPLIIT